MKYSLILCLFLCGCSLINSSENDEAVKSSTTESVTPSQVVSYYDEPLANNVNDYAKWLVQDLFATIDFPANDEIFMVADLAILDSDLNETNLFGRQMGEAILHEVHQTGFSTIDIKSTGFVRVSEKGDIFIESRDYTELQQTISATNVITGTLTKYRGGYLLNARALAISSNMLIASAQIFVPHSVVDSVIEENLSTQAEIDQEKADLSNQKNTGIPLKKYSAKE